jgi:membrane protein YqaA with SNARE-associated domain
LLVAFGVAIGSAIFPPISVELFVVGLASKEPHIPWLAFGAVIAIGQVLGKLLYYYAGKGSLRLPDFLHKRTVGTVPDKNAVRRPVDNWWRKVMAWLRVKWAWLRDKCHRHPGWMFGATLTSSVIGLPPFMAMTVLAGIAGLSLRTFIMATLPGRFVRFSALAASPVVFHHVMHMTHLHL